MNDPRQGSGHAVPHPTGQPQQQPHRPQPVQPIHPQQPRPLLQPQQHPQQQHPQQQQPRVGFATPPRVGAAVPVQPQRPQQMQQQQLAPRAVVDAEEPIALDELVEVEEAAEPAPTSTMNKIKFGPELGHKKHDWKRKTTSDGKGACRMKSFHGKYSDQGLEYLDDCVNEWLDSHPDVEVKFVTSTVGVFEGKTREPALVLNVWY